MRSRLTLAIIVVLLLGGVCPSLAQAVASPVSAVTQSHLAAALPGTPARIVHPKRVSTLAPPAAPGALASANVLPTLDVAKHTATDRVELPRTPDALFVSTRAPPSEYTSLI